MKVVTYLTANLRKDFIYIGEMSPFTSTGCDNDMVSNGDK